MTLEGINKASDYGLLLFVTRAMQVYGILINFPFVNNEYGISKEEILTSMYNLDVDVIVWK